MAKKTNYYFIPKCKLKLQVQLQSISIMATLKQAANEILTTKRQHLTYHFSVAEKENQSGIFWNTRVLFLLEGHHFGYISEVKEEEPIKDIAFDKCKATVICTDIKRVSGQADKVEVAFWATVDDKKIEKKWLFKLASNKLGRQWYTKLRQAKERSHSVNYQEQLQPIVEQKREETPPKNKNLRISRNINLSENLKREKKVRQIAINATDQSIFQQPRSKPSRDSMILLDQIYSRPKPITEEELAKIQEEKTDKAIVKEESLQPASLSKRQSSPPPATLQEIPSKPAALTLTNKTYLETIKNHYSSQLHSSQSSLDNRSKPHSSIRHSKLDRPKNTYRNQGGDTELSWTYRYVKSNHLIFSDFKTFTLQLLQDIVSDLPNTRQNSRYKPKLIKNGIRYYNIDDIQVKLALIQLQDVYAHQSSVEGERVCQKEAIKTLQNEFNNFKALYEYLGDSPRLKVPLMSLCKYMGFVALFKVQSQHVQRQPSLRQVQSQLMDLKEKSKIEIDFEGNLNRVIIQLDEDYYNKHKTPQDRDICFSIFIIQELDCFLIPDVLSELKEPYRLLRPQFTSNNIQHPFSVNYTALQQEEVPIQLEQLSKKFLKTLSDAIIDIDSLRVYFLNSKQMSKFLHSKGINIHYIGHIYQHVKNAFQRRFFMSQMAARCCKVLFHKTIQDLHLESNPASPEWLHGKLCDFFNCILGNTYETAAVWKVLSTHAVSNYGISLDYDQIDKEMFIIAVIFNCKLQVEWPKIRSQEVFKSNSFFTSSNLLGLQANSKVYPPLYSTQYQTALSALNKPESTESFTEVVRQLDLKNGPLPLSVDSLTPRLLKYLSIFIPPEKAKTEYSHLRLFDRLEHQAPFRHLFDLCLMQLKWHLKRKQKKEYISCCDIYIRQATIRYGQFHPILSQLYDLFAAYHLNCAHYEDAIVFSKSSLVNILKVCGGNHERTSQCYYHLALCYIRANRRDQAIVHIRKSKLIFESNHSTNSVAYSTMSLKLALLLLNQNEIEECLNTTTQAFQLFESKRSNNSEVKYEDQITECFELMSRCYEILQAREEIQHLSEQCFIRLSRITQPYNLQKVLKIYLYPLLSGLPSDQAALYLDILALFKTQSTQKEYLIAHKEIFARISENSLGSSLAVYLSKLQVINNSIREHSLANNWVNFQQIYPRQTVKDFMSLSVELLTFLGEGYMAGALREAL